MSRYVKHKRVPISVGILTVWVCRWPGVAEMWCRIWGVRTSQNARPHRRKSLKPRKCLHPTTRRRSNQPNASAPRWLTRRACLEKSEVSMDCQECGYPTRHRTRCADCGKYVCRYCFHHSFHNKTQISPLCPVRAKQIRDAAAARAPLTTTSVQLSERRQRRRRLFPWMRSTK